MKIEVMYKGVNAKLWFETIGKMEHLLSFNKFKSELIPARCFFHPDIVYVDYATIITDFLIPSGISHTRIFDALYTELLTPEITRMTPRKVKNATINYVLDNEETPSVPAVKRVVYEAVFPNVPRDIIAENFRFPEVLHWVNRHGNWFKTNETTDIRLPCGRSFAWHKHSYVDVIKYLPHEAYKDKSVRQVLEIIHPRIVEMCYNMIDDNVPLPTLHIDLPKGVTQLVTSDELINEGVKMNHCVGGYKRRCLSENAFIFHITTEKGAESTLHLEAGIQLNGTVVWSIIQHKGVGNSPVSAEAQSLAIVFGLVLRNSINNQDKLTEVLKCPTN